jgi:hypothetical protein
MNRSFIAIALCSLIAACGQAESPKKSKAEMMLDEDTALLKDPERAESELARRLLTRVQIKDGIVVVRNPVTSAIETYFLPTNTPWVLKCGMGGLSVVFGNSVSGEAASNDVNVYLSFGSADQETCAVIGPRLAGRLKSLLQPDH